MSLLTNIFENKTSPSTVQMEETKWAELIEKYQYDFKLSPMQNAYLEILSRFNGNCPYPELKSMITSYTMCLKRDSHDKCNSMLTEIKSNEGLNLNEFPLHTFKNKFPFVQVYKNKDTVYRHELAINDLVQSCPNYYTPGTDPEATEKCYLASLKYWQDVMELHVETLVNSDHYAKITKILKKTKFDQTENSMLLRKYYFNNGNFPYPRYGNFD
jgi:hypothetical protein